MSIVAELLHEERQGVKEGTATSSAPRTSKQNLESRIESLIRSIQNLSEKKLRIDFELKRQKRSLARKREELKRVSKSSHARAKISLESSVDPQIEKETMMVEKKRTQSLLQESARILEE